MKPANTLLIVADKREGAPIQECLSEDFERVLFAEDGKQVLEILRGDEATIDLVVLRFVMSDSVALETMRHLRERRMDLPVLCVSEGGGIETALQALRLGAKDCVEPPLHPEYMRTKARSILSERATRRENEMLRNRLAAYSTSFSLIGSSNALSHVTFTIAKVSRMDCAVLVLGEPGTGKEMVARAIHYLGPRASEPYQRIDCGSIQESMLECELFGVEQGAIPNSPNRRAGLLQAAGRGTVFLDEICEIPMEIQARLLQILQGHRIRPVGGAPTIPFRARLVAATNRDIAAEVRSGRFNAELYHLLQVVEIPIPPLRERKEDIPALVEFFLTKHTMEGRTVHTISLETMKALMEHSWPGNIRELEDSIQRAVTTGKSIELDAADILSASKFEAAPEILTDTGRRQVDSLGEYERLATVRALEACGGDRKLAATLLGIGEAALHRRLGEPESVDSPYGA